MQMKSIFSRPFKYGGVWIKPQAEFSVKSVRDCKLLEVAKRAKMLAAAPAPKKAPATDAPAKRAPYKRRDIAPEHTVVMRPAEVTVARPKVVAIDEAPAPAVAPEPAAEVQQPEAAAKLTAPTGDE